jgi:gliding motility-associated-like protein
MIFFEGDLYMASLSGIVKVNISNPSLSTMHIAMNSTAVYGMAVLSVDCNLNKVYAFETIAAGDATNVIELDLVNRTVVGTACQIPFVPGKGQIRVIREPGQAEYTYLLNSTISNTTGIFENLDPGTYRIEISTPGGCYLDTSVVVPFFDPVIPSVIERHINPDCIEAGKAWFTISPDNGRNKIIYKQDTLSAAFLFEDLEEGLHHFSVVDEYFCELQAFDLQLSLEGSCDTMYFPTAFTPNNDGRNDQFRGLGNRSVRDYELSVYNRWGEKIFNTRNVLSGWNGKINGVDQPSGIYIWVAGYTTPKGIKKNVKGTTILIR